MIYDDNDSFQLHDAGSFNVASLQTNLPSIDSSESSEESKDPSRVTKHIVAYDSSEELPSQTQTPRFDHGAYFRHLKHYQKRSKVALDSAYGATVLYGEVVTSTNTLLEKNTKLLRRLPAGFLATASVQVAGRGRGSNVWVSPSGSLMFSIVVRHEKELITKAPIIFLQYLAAMAVTQGVHTYDAGYEDLPVRLKWPNDIYALDPAQPTGKRSFVKIGGVLVNSHYSASEYISVIGIGLNTANALPTTSLAALLPPKLPGFTPEKLLARIITAFSGLYTHFRAHGFDARLEQQYYQAWLHSEQVVTLETEGGIRARIKGLTTDWGFLKAEELGWNDRSTGRMVQLQPDSNSFDFFKGLVKHRI
jgi:biotin---protein ligase